MQKKELLAVLEIDITVENGNKLLDILRTLASKDIDFIVETALQVQHENSSTKLEPSAQ